MKIIKSEIPFLFCYYAHNNFKSLQIQLVSSVVFKELNVTQLLTYYKDTKNQDHTNEATYSDLHSPYFISFIRYNNILFYFSNNELLKSAFTD